MIYLTDEYIRLIGYPIAREPKKGELQDIIDQLITIPEYHDWGAYLYGLR